MIALKSKAVIILVVFIFAWQSVCSVPFVRLPSLNESHRTLYAVEIIPEKSDASLKEEPNVEATEASVTQFQETQVILTPEEVSEIIKKSIQFGINDEEVYAPEKLTRWSTNITEECIQRLADLKKPFKYIVFCDVGQNYGNGMHHMITTYWDRLKDRVYTQAWTNTTIIAIVTVIGVCTEITRDTMM